MIEFSAGRAGMLPLSWGQRAIWDAIRLVEPQEAYFNFGRVLPVPERAGRVTPERAAALVGELVSRHDALRSRVHEGPHREIAGRLTDGTRQTIAGRLTDGTRQTIAGRLSDGPHQTIAGAGRLPVTVVADGSGRELLDELTGSRFDYTADWPLRVGLITGGGAVREVVFAFSHLAADGQSADVLLRELRMLLLGRGLPRPPALQLMDLVEREQGSSCASVLGFWEEQLRALPPTMFGTPVAAPLSPRFRTAALTSPALANAAAALAGRHGVSTSTVLLTAATRMVGDVTGHPVCAITPIASNRFQPELRDLVAPLSLLGLFVLNVREKPGLGELLERARPAALRAYRLARYDPVLWEAMAARLSAERGTQVHPLCCFNDLRFAEELPKPPAYAPGPATLDWTESFDQHDCRFCLHVSGGPQALTVALTADTAYLPPEAMEAYLWGLEHLVCHEFIATGSPSLDAPERRP